MCAIYAGELKRPGAYAGQHRSDQPTRPCRRQKRASVISY